MAWKCTVCGDVAAEAPLCFSAEAPWRQLVPESEFEKRVDLTGDQCVVDGQAFFIRGHVEVPIHTRHEPLAFSVWSSLSKPSFIHMSKRWSVADRINDEPYFGWLSSSIPVYPNTINLKVSVHSRTVGLTPLFTLQPTEHLLSLEQQNGITVSRWHEIAHRLLHDGT